MVWWIRWEDICHLMILNQEIQVPQGIKQIIKVIKVIIKGKLNQKEQSSGLSCDWEVQSGRADRRAEIYGETKSCWVWGRNPMNPATSGSAVSKAILKLVYQFGISNSDPKLSKVLISGVSFCHCSLSQSHESNVLSYSECKIAEKFSGLCPLTPLGRAYSTPSPRLPSCTTVFLLAMLLEKPAPPKKYWIQHWVAKAKAGAKILEELIEKSKEKLLKNNNRKGMNILNWPVNYYVRGLHITAYQ